jgi:hypothetical protein
VHKYPSVRLIRRYPLRMVGLAPHEGLSMERLRDADAEPMFTAFFCRVFLSLSAIVDLVFSVSIRVQPWVHSLHGERTWIPVPCSRPWSNSR